MMEAGNITTSPHLLLNPDGNAPEAQSQ